MLFYDSCVRVLVLENVCHIFFVFHDFSCFLQWNTSWTPLGPRRSCSRTRNLNTHTHKRENHAHSSARKPRMSGTRRRNTISQSTITFFKTHIMKLTRASEKPAIIAVLLASSSTLRAKYLCASSSVVPSRAASSLVCKYLHSTRKINSENFPRVEK